MTYKATTIKKIIADIDQNKVYLPALQRKFVWGKQQIETLFDSLMRDYPIGTFLFWSITRQKAGEFVFYEFLKEYDERHPYNRRKTGAFTHEQIIGVLDGQQRLSAMYLGLMGSHTEKTPYKRWNNPDAFEKTVLYLNLLSLPMNISADNNIVENEDRDYEFFFLTSSDAEMASRPLKSDTGAVLGQEATLWMKVAETLSWDADLDTDKVMEQLGHRCDDQQAAALQANRRLVRHALGLLHKRIYQQELVNYFEVAKDDLEDILKIFVRVNSGGTVLNKTDLLFSTIVATWDDGREQIEELLKTINERGDGFNFGNEFLMRCCLVLTDGPVVYRVNSFKAENVQRIRDEWPKIAGAVRKLVDMLAEFGFSGELLPSQNATIIMAYYLYKGGQTDAGSKQALRLFLVHALLKRTFSGSQDQVITALRHGFRDEALGRDATGGFPGRFNKLTFDDILSIELPQEKLLKVARSDIDRFLGYSKGADAFLVLSLLYPQLRFADTVFHQDHIHPFARFSNAGLAEAGIPKEQWEEFNRLRDTVPNLQLLNGPLNSAKSDKRFADWFAAMPQHERTVFEQNNFLPSEVGYDFANFTTFVARRREMLAAALSKVLYLDSRRDIDLEVREQLDNAVVNQMGDVV